jgi:hypothetical protein
MVLNLSMDGSPGQMLRDELRGERCWSCGTSLSAAKSLKRHVRVLRSGPAIGNRAEVIAATCACGHRAQIVWSLITPRRAA